MAKTLPSDDIQRVANALANSNQVLKALLTQIKFGKSTATNLIEQVQRNSAALAILGYKPV